MAIRSRWLPVSGSRDSVSFASPKITASRSAQQFVVLLQGDLFRLLILAGGLLPIAHENQIGDHDLERGNPNQGHRPDRVFRQVAIHVPAGGERRLRFRSDSAVRTPAGADALWRCCGSLATSELTNWCSNQSPNAKQAV